MNLALSEHLPLIASSPDGIQKLRGLILELAARGKLEPQDKNDEPASKLIDRILAERIQREARGEVKKLKPVQDVSRSMYPFELPHGWEFVCLGNLLLGISSGGTPSKSNPHFWDGDIPWASVKDLSFGEPLTNTQDKISAAGLAAGSFLASAGSILVCTRMGLGKIGEAKIEVAINQDLKALQLGSEFNKQYFINFFKTLSIKGSGMTVAGIKQDELLGFVVPVPPLAEQHRIVAKVNELMALCDRLESEQNDSAAAHTQLVKTLLCTLSQSTSAADFEANWQRIAEHFETLFTTEASIGELQKTILQLAVMGKLVPQDPKDEPIHESLQQLDFTQPVSKAGRGSNTSKLPSITENDVEFPAPSGWQWIWLGEIGTTNIGLTYSPNNLSSSGTPVLRSNNVQNGKLNLTDLVRVSTDVKESVLVQEGDLLICARNGSKALVGKTAQIGALNEKMAFGAFMAIFRSPFNSYLRCFINSPLFRRMIDEVNTTTINQITQSNLRSTAVPLPPIAEQCRIVSKVDELMALCESLKTQLAESSRQEARLADALVQQSLGAV